MDRGMEILNKVKWYISDIYIGNEVPLRTDTTTIVTI